MSEPSIDDYAYYRMEKAKSTLEEIKVLIEHEFWNLAINRMYYACFYGVSALLIKKEVHTSSHSGTRQKFGQLFVQTNIFEKHLAKHYARLFEKRHKGDYNDFFDYEKEEVLELYPITIEFLNEITAYFNSTR